jgi:nucleoid-associated protein YgaU
MAKKGLFGLFGSKEEKEEPKKAEEKFIDMKGKISNVDPDKARADARRAKAKKQPATEAKKVIKKHVVVSGDTLSGIAKKYYDDAGKYMVIYKANKELIGDNPDLIQPGMDLVIPEL